MKGCVDIVWKCIGSLFGVLFLLLSIVCGRIYTFSPVIPASSTTQKGSVKNYVSIRGQIHIHSRRSYDATGSLEEISSAARAIGVHWVILTDHPSELANNDRQPMSSMQNGVLFVHGDEEYRKKRGSLISAEAEDPAASFRACGHVEEFMHTNDFAWDALELVNLHANVVEHRWSILASLFVAPNHLYRRMLYIRPENLGFWQQQSERRGKPIPIFSATDAHANVRLFGKTLDTYEKMFALTATHAILSDGEPLNALSLISALKNGRTFISFPYLGDIFGFAFYADSESGINHAGATVNLPSRLVVKNPVREGTEVRLYRNNQLQAIKHEEGEVEIKDPAPGFWRVEIYRHELLWIISGQILIRHSF